MEAPDALADAVEAALEFKFGKSAGIAAGVAATSALTPILGPSAVVAGRVTQVGVEALTTLVLGDENTKNFLAAGLKYEATEAGRKEFEQGVVRGLERWFESSGLLAEMDELRQAVIRALGHQIDDLRRTLLEPFNSRVLSLTSANGSDQEILDSFGQASSIGRGWTRTISGQRIPRPELDELIEWIEDGTRTILIADRPGTGKTCLLLDLVERIERRDGDWALLFIKGDQFSSAGTETQLVSLGLPEDVVGRCHQLAASRRVVVIVDSLDTLSADRSHGTLRLLLSVIDRLRTIGNVSVVAACREFDRRYDPQLRGQSWQKVLPIRPLDYETIVKPLLQSWSIDEALLDDRFRDLMRLPRNLSLLAMVAERRALTSVSSVHELYQGVLNELVSKDPVLGSNTLAALRELANKLLTRRTQVFAQSELPLEDAQLQRLQSLELLVETSPGILSFGHQSLAEFLAVQSARARGQSLSEFIVDHPPLPFIRPTVRAFALAVRTEGPDVFGKQIWQVLVNDDIALHLKRLVVETIADIEPVQADWSLVRRIFLRHDTLFRRMLTRTRGREWCRFLMEHWWPEVKSGTSTVEWLKLFSFHARVWAHECPTELIELWERGLASFPDPKLAERIVFSLEDFHDWHVNGIRNLLERLLQFSEVRRFSGKALSRWVSATNAGDDLLWCLVVNGSTFDDDDESPALEPLCSAHHFCAEEFLRQRLRESNALLTLAVDSLLAARSDLGDRLLFSTSWRDRHTLGEARIVTPRHELLDMIEAALKLRATHNDTWWLKYEPRLRVTSALGLRYLTLQAYRVNLSANIPGIEAQLADFQLLRSGKLDDELADLMRIAYPELSEAAQEANQRTILSLLQLSRTADADSVQEDEWLYHWMHGLILSIPAVFRSDECQLIVTQWQHKFGSSRPSAQVYMWGGVVSSPVPTDALITLSVKELVRLLLHYAGSNTPHEVLDDGSSVGGRRQVQEALRAASSLDPNRFLELIPEFRTHGVHNGYVRAVAAGVAEHICFRSGARHANQGWKPVEPLESLALLAQSLLTVAEAAWSLTPSSRDELASDGVLDACASALRDEVSLERLTWLLFRFLSADDSDPEGERESRELEVVSYSSTRGKAAEIATRLCCYCLQDGVQVPRLLPNLLQHFARDPSPAVRVALLGPLGFLLEKQAALGWQLLERAMRDQPGPLARYAEPILNRQCHLNFGSVAPILEHIRAKGLEQGGSTYGRVLTLACLAGHVAPATLMAELNATNAHVRKGAAQVFCANLSNPTNRTVCESGLRLLVEDPACPKAIIDVIDPYWGDEKVSSCFDFAFATAFVSAVERQSCPQALGGIVEWLELRAHANPEAALSIFESMAQLYAAAAKPIYHHSEHIVSALLEVLREADQTDDEDLIRRAIQLQDTFLELDMPGFDQLLHAAAG